MRQKSEHRESSAPVKVLLPQATNASRVLHGARQGQVRADQLPGLLPFVLGEAPAPPT